MNLDRLSLPVRLAVLAMLVVALAVSAALYAAWRTTDARLTAQIDTDLNTQQREWDRLATANPPRDTASLLATAGAWVREQQDHPARQLQAVAVTGARRARTALGVRWPTMPTSRRCCRPVARATCAWPTAPTCGCSPGRCPPRGAGPVARPARRGRRRRPDRSADGRAAPARARQRAHRRGRDGAGRPARRRRLGAHHAPAAPPRARRGRRRSQGSRGARGRRARRPGSA